MTLRLAVVGVGDVAERDYLPELGRFAGVLEVVIACSRTAARARAAAERFAIPRWTDSLDEAVTADDVDAVVNLTPIPAHLDVTLAALRAGKHVYSEKPLAGSVAEADLIGREAADHGCTVVAAPCVLLFPQVVRAREVLDRGELGPVHSARGHGLGGVPPWEGYLSDPAPFFAADAGPLVDMAVYPLHALTGLLGRVRRVAALSGRTRTSFTIVEGALASSVVPVTADDNWHLALELESGALASVEANNCAGAAIAPELELRGERGALGVSLLDVSAPVRVTRDGRELTEVVPHRRDAGPDHALGIVHLAECVATGAEPSIGIGPARHVLEILEAARRSVVERRTVEIGGDD
jgi:predicted dehydrogenase